MVRRRVSLESTTGTDAANGAIKAVVASGSTVRAGQQGGEPAMPGSDPYVMRGAIITRHASTDSPDGERPPPAYRTAIAGAPFGHTVLT
eukprot:3140590-Rhodomonas_salina.1